MADKELKMKVKDLKEYCTVNRIPLFILADKTCTTVTPEEIGKETDRKYNLLIAAMAGFDRNDF